MTHSRTICHNYAPVSLGRANLGLQAGYMKGAACMQAGAGLVADSVPESEYEETLNKAAALGRAIDLAEQAFVEC